MYLLGTVLWLAASGFIAWHVARMLLGWTRWKGNVLLRSGLAVLLLPVTFMAPLADEIVGKYQFDRLCEEAKEVKIYGTIPVGGELYTPEGKWRSSETGDNDFHLQQLRESLVLWDTGGPFPKEIAAFIPVRMHHTKLYERKSKRLLAEWSQFSTPGGWLSQNFQLPLLVSRQCMPNIDEMQRLIMPFKAA